MIAMAVQDDWISPEEAAKVAGCSPQFIRRELDRHLDEATMRTKGGRLDGWRASGKAWLVLRSSAAAMRETLSTRARSRASERKSKVAKRAAKKAAKRKPS